MGFEELEKRAAELGLPLHIYMRQSAQRALKLTAELNATWHEPEEVVRLFSELTGREVGEGFCLFPPFYTDYGQNITVERNVFINGGCHFQDQGGITIGEGTLIGHKVVIATLDHDQRPSHRQELIPAPVVIGKNVWIGANATLRCNHWRWRHRGRWSCSHQRRPGNDHSWWRTGTYHQANST